MADFNIVLIAAVVSFVILLIAFNSDFTFTAFGGTNNDNNHLPPDRTVEFNNFEVFYSASEESTGHFDGQVNNGVFGGETKISGFHLSNPSEVSSALIDLNTSQSNYYGRLMILVNDNEVYADYPPVGEKMISFERSVLEKDNVIKFVAESSGWRIWAPTVYDINGSVVVDYFDKRSMAFTFDVNEEELDRVGRARLAVYGDRQGTGNLGIAINGVKVYSGVTTVYREFATSILRKGNNTIDFYTEPNTRYNISSAQVILFFE